MTEVLQEESTPQPPTIPLDVVRSKNLKLRELTGGLRDQLIHDCYKARRPSEDSAEKIFTTLKAILVLLYQATCVSENCCLAVPRDNNLYTTGTRLNKLFFSRDITVRVIDWLLEQGYVTLAKEGVRFEKPHDWYADKELTGYVSCYLPTAKLIGFFQENMLRLNELQAEIVIEDLVELRDIEGNILDLPKDEIVAHSRKLLADYNALLQQTYIDWDEAVGIQPKEPPDKCNKIVRRIFSRDLKHGGRFYGGWWQNLPERDTHKDTETGKVTTRQMHRRLFLYLNGEISAEIDFRSVHPTLLYVREGLDLRKYASIKDGVPDLYQNVVFSNNIPKDRKLAKKAFLIGLNAESSKNKCAALRKEISKDRASYPAFERLDDDTMEGVFKRIYGAYPSLKEYFGTGVGLELQYWDSLIAEEVLSKFTCHFKVPVLSLHDSFLVPATFYKELAHTMFEAFNSVSQLMNPKNTIQYEMGDILDFDNAFMSAQTALARKLDDKELMKKFTEEERMLAEAAAIMLEDEVSRPIHLRQDCWKEEENNLPFDAIDYLLFTTYNSKQKRQ